MDTIKRARRDAYWSERSGLLLAIRVAVIAIVTAGTVTLIVIAFLLQPR